MSGCWGLIFFLLGYVQAGKVCYDKIGCFTDDKPWSGTLERLIGRLPESPEHINTHLLMFTRENPDMFQELHSLNPSALPLTNFKTNRKSRFIIHGFLEQGEENWLVNMCKTMLKVEDVNCFCVDWSGGSRTLYSQAANNIRVVGAELAYFISFLSNNMNYSLSKVHVIGHSLGSHTAGEVGKRVPGIGRITGLDPAGPFFQDTPPEVRLDPTDALFVDVIHTDTSPLIPKMGYGMRQSVGHMDFFPNGGESMRGCNKPIVAKLLDIDGLWEGSRDIFACNHLRSYKYYTESITSPNGFIGYPSTSYGEFTKGNGFPCPSSGCPLMGHYADLFSGHGINEHSYFLNTGSEKPYSRWRYRVTVKTTGRLNFFGSIQVSLHGVKGSTTGQEIARRLIKPGQTYTAFIDVEADVGPLTTVSFSWNKSLIDIIPSKVGAEMISVQYGKDGQTYKFCGKDTVRAKSLQSLTSCSSATK
ncbi:pancreatic lipase-related protein 1 S homeolog precursor [Xenopus laevis]|uniref:Triacylglycerol lipase n=1 Tax=Xenopus laevis TaxID=8355 RepID=Q642R3_XENLA|nr:pancreatic lipase-related protein 1 S homeolog precursor [Xenopus laevis]AAH81107.1 MGC83411 protein [Xenopus laevis]